MIVASTRVTSIDELPPRAPFSAICRRSRCCGSQGTRFPGWYRRALERYRYGMGVFKVDWALDGADSLARRRRARAPGPLHLGGTLDEIAAVGARRVGRTGIADRPFVLLAQPTLFDPSRAPAGKHTGVGATATCRTHRPSTCSTAIEQQIERFAPGFRDRVLARISDDAGRYRSATTPNLVGGDIAAGVDRSAPVLHAPDLADLLDAGARASTSARPPRRPASACTACAAISPR